jgi:DNA-binding MarR family transcriptional regulator
VPVTDDPWLDEVEQGAWRAYILMRRRLESHLAAHLQRESGLSTPDYEVLVNLSEAPGESMRAGELLESTEWEKSRLSHHLTRMEKRGLVRRDPCPDDRRSSYIVLTDCGRDAINRAAPSHVQHVRSLFVEAMSRDELVSFTERCNAVAERVGTSSG